MPWRIEQLTSCFFFCRAPRTIQHRRHPQPTIPAFDGRWPSCSCRATLRDATSNTSTKVGRLDKVFPKSVTRACNNSEVHQRNVPNIWFGTHSPVGWPSTRDFVVASRPVDFPHDGSNDQTLRNSARFHLGTDVDGLPSPLVATFHDPISTTV